MIYVESYRVYFNSLDKTIANPDKTQICILDTKMKEKTAIFYIAFWVENKKKFVFSNKCLLCY